MLTSLLFIQAILLHRDRLKELLGEQWATSRQTLSSLLTDLIQEVDPQKAAARVNRIYRALEATHARELVRSLFRQAYEQGELEYAIEQYEKQLERCKAQDHPEEWATIHNALGAAYTCRLRGERASNLEQAIAHYEQALSVYSQHAFPEHWAAIQGNLANVYISRMVGDGAANLHKAIEHRAQEHAHLTMHTSLSAQHVRTAELQLDGQQSGQDTELEVSCLEDLRFAAKELAAAFEPAREVTTHPNLLGDDYAYLSKTYRLMVKLSDQPQPGGAALSAPKLKIPVEEGEAIKKIQVKLTAPDFDLDPGDTALGWLRELDFYPQAAASNAIAFALRPLDRFEERYFSALRVQFVLNGQVLGQAARRIEVLRDDAAEKTPLNGFPPAPRYPLDERGEVRIDPVPTPITYRSDEPLVHLTVTISEPFEGRQLLWEIVSPYLGIGDFPEGQYYSRNLGAEEFVKEYLAPFGMPGKWPEDHMDQDGCLRVLSVNILYNNLLTLRRNAPPQFWQIYELALERHLAKGLTAEDFTVLFITADTHVPWELMPASENVISDKMPPLLGSAHRVGRWLLDVGVPTPDAEIALHGFSVAAPTYSDRPLPQAQQERAFIEQHHYFPQILPDDANAFIAFMKTGQPSNGTGILHFAGHGDCCTDTLRRNWLVLTNRQALYDVNSASTDLGNRLGKLSPTFAFFNACNVGRAAPGPLGSNGGWGRALLNQQYKGYLGPLWSVYDEHARDICTMFYSSALDERLPLGEVMRRIRARFTEDNRLFTYLAYLYLGHPLAMITYTPFQD